MLMSLSEVVVSPWGTRRSEQKRVEHVKGIVEGRAVELLVVVHSCFVVDSSS